MSQKFFYLFMLFASLIVNSQNNISASQWKAINQRIDSIDNINGNLIKNNNDALVGLKISKSTLDSLNRELLYFKAKEDYYSTALSDQSNRFALIVSGILALFAILSFGAFKYEVKEIKRLTNKKITKQNKKLYGYKQDLSSTQAKLYVAQGNLFALIGSQFKEEKEDFVNAFHVHIVAAKCHGLARKLWWSTENPKEEDGYSFEYAISNLHNARCCIQEICEQEDIQALRLIEDDIKKEIDVIYQLEDETIKNEILNIRVLLNQTLKIETK